MLIGLQSTRLLLSLQMQQMPHSITKSKMQCMKVSKLSARRFVRRFSHAMQPVRLRQLYVTFWHTAPLILLARLASYTRKTARS